MFADFRTATSGTGKSFKGALDYFLNDKGEGDARPTSDERVDVLELRNLATDNPRHAWFEMMNTAHASGALKEAAGVRKGGRVGEKPVFTYHLAWHDSECPERAEMMKAARSTLKLLGLERHQALIVAHTDTAHPHVHVIVNRVDPENGRYAGLSNSWKELKAWAIEYSKERGTNWHIPLEQAKEARESRKQTARQSAFNRTARGFPAIEQPPAAKPPKPPSRAEWEARKAASSNDNRATEAKAAGEIRAKYNEKWQALRAAEKEGSERCANELERYREDRQIGRNAIYAKYEETFKGIWRAGKIETPSRNVPLDPAILNRLAVQHQKFEKNERGVFGRLMNARMLAKGQGLAAVAKLALNSTERRRLFDTVQRKTAGPGRWGLRVPQAPARPGISKKAQSDTAKAMRTRELAQFDRETRQGRDALAARHSEQLENMRAAKAQLSAEGKAAWAGHAEIYRPAKEAQGLAKVRTASTRPQQAEKPQEATQDRFGRSRDRKPRPPRQPRQEAAQKAEKVESADAKRETAKPFNQAVRAESDHEAEAARIAAEYEARWEAERKANERDNDHDPGRER